MRNSHRLPRFSAFACIFILSVLLFSTVSAASGTTVPDGAAAYIYTLDTDGIDDGGIYLIASGSSGTVSVLTNQNGTAAGTEVTVSSKAITVTDSTNIGWTIRQRSSSAFFVEHNGSNLYPDGSSSLLTPAASDTYLNIRAGSSGKYAVYTRSNWLTYASKKWKTAASEKFVYLYALSKVDLAPVTVVLDYGLPVDIHTPSEGLHTVVAIGPAADMPENGFSAALDGAFSGETLTLESGNVSITDGQLRFTPGPGFMHLTSGAEFAYAAACDFGYVYGKVTVVPASCVYYEEEFVLFGDGWTTEGSPIVRTQSDAAAPYGFDPAYADMPQFSMGTARKVSLSGTGSAKAEFSFTGTGFEVVGLTGTDSGVFLAEIYQNDTPLRRVLVDGFYSSGTLRQVPVLKLTGLEHDRYRVVLTAAYSAAFDHTGSGSCAFYLDGVRIYGTANAEPALSAHLAHGEGYPDFVRLRDLLLSEEALPPEDGLLIDGRADATLSQYASYGPKNEVYLAPGQVLVLNAGLADRAFSSAHIGLRALNGTAVCSLSAAGSSEDRTLILNTACAMFYDLTDLAGQTILITNTGDGVLALTDLKITYPVKP